MPETFGRSADPFRVGMPVPGLSRRTFLQAAAALGVAAPMLSACGGSDSSSTSGGDSGTPTGSVTFGSNGSDAKPKAAYATTMKAFETATPGVTVKVNTVDHNTFQQQINTYLQGSPDDVFTWFAGYRMRFFADKGLAGDISDVWSTIGADYGEGFKQASTSDDDKQYFVPLYYYPWGLFYRKSVFAEKGYTVPTKLDEFTALCDKMKADGLIPLAFADKDGWPAMGTFDAINCRLNGYDFHVSLMAGKESWESGQVKDVWKAWADLLPYHQEGSLGRTWQEAANALVGKQAGMYQLGAFVGQQFPEGDSEDLDFFLWPEMNAEYGQDTVEAPIDGFMMAAKPKNEAGAKALLTYLGGPEAFTVYATEDPSANVATNTKADITAYTALQKRAKDVVEGAAHITQFMDRDTRPDFATTVMIPALQKFIGDPSDIDGLSKSIESQKKTIFTT